MKLLFPNASAARDVAFMLRCKYDDCNAVYLPKNYDCAAVCTAIELVGTDFCMMGQHYPVDPITVLTNDLSEILGEDITERRTASPANSNH